MSIILYDKNGNDFQYQLPAIIYLLKRNDQYAYIKLESQSIFHIKIKGREGKRIIFSFFDGFLLIFKDEDEGKVYKFHKKGVSIFSFNGVFQAELGLKEKENLIISRYQYLNAMSNSFFNANFDLIKLKMNDCIEIQPLEYLW
jgi:hypothetical protein